MRLSIYGKVTGLFLGVTVLLGWILGLGSLGLLGQLEAAVTDAGAFSGALAWQRTRGMIVLYTLVSTAAVVLAGVLVLRRWLRAPMHRILSGVDRIVREGDFDHRIQIQQPDDLSHLARAINRLARDLRSRASTADTRNTHKPIEERQKDEEFQTRTACGRR
jgi:nitrate/nitrite-specific signal transduction histidine kinase